MDYSNLFPNAFRELLGKWAFIIEPWFAFPFFALVVILVIAGNIYLKRRKK